MMSMTYKLKPLVDPSTPTHLIDREVNRKLKLHEASRQTLQELLAQSDPDARRTLYATLCKVNDEAGIPTESAEALGVAP